MTKTHTPLIIEGKIYVVVDAPEFSGDEDSIVDLLKYQTILKDCTKYPILEQDVPYWKERIWQRVEVEIKKVWCHANKDWGCRYKDCPQLRDNEPETTGRSCPLDHLDYDEEPKMYTVIPGTHILDYKTAIPPQKDPLVNMLVTASVGTQSQHDAIQAHMDEYFKRWPSYKDRLTELEWYHLFLDFSDKLAIPPQQKQGDEKVWDELFFDFGRWMCNVDDDRTEEQFKSDLKSKYNPPTKK